MTLESSNLGKQEKPKSIEVNDFDVSFTPTENPDYVTVTLKREGINFDTVVRIEDCSIATEIVIDSSDIQRSRGSLLATMIPDTIKLALERYKSPDEAEESQGEFDLEDPDYDVWGSTPGRRATKDRGGPE